MNPYGSLPFPDPVPDCTECATFRRRLAEVSLDDSAAADVRVLWRRHAAERHGQQFSILQHPPQQ
ncbi:hypothetical protein C7C46_00995 [Streptomyces tateyamensis]|uniref:Uncharacterized protein n=1 Tax=Streptomyces tateyamensis TaxID=565073 RepID=A0A2V4P3K3_9ACTN|nr:hypothetical protein [Streptomyces tateyamensis]PYC88255.1 hypothetical protein C7C46_00995 [Streptomyces tateyamensis]